MKSSVVDYLYLCCCFGLNSTSMRSLLLLRLLLVLLMAPAVVPCQPFNCLAEGPTNHWQKCPGTTLGKKMRCNYANVDAFRLQANEKSTAFPSQPRNFSIAFYTASFPGVDLCTPVINFTWQLPQDGSVDCLEGFLLNITFTFDGKPQRILRLFNVSHNKDLFPEDLINIVFHYDCFVPMPKTFYKIELRSIPSAAHNYVTQYLQIYENVNANNTANWKASIWAMSKDGLNASTLGVCFTLAPEDFQFFKYNIYLVGHSSGSLRLIRYKATVENNPTVTDFMCYTFHAVCADFYRIEIQPVATKKPSCNCTLESKCVDHCSTSVLEKNDMTQSWLSCSDPPNISPTIRPTSRPTPHPDLSSKIEGIIAGSFLGLIFFGVIIIIIVVILVRRRWVSQPPPNPDPEKLVLILYWSDGEDGQMKIIRSLAEFLQTRCPCRTVFENWTEESTPEHVWQQILESSYTLFVISEEGLDRYKRFVNAGAWTPPIRRQSLANQAVIAVLMRLAYEREHKLIRKKCFWIQLPSSTKDHPFQNSVEHSYQLPNELSDLLQTLRTENGTGTDRRRRRLVFRSIRWLKTLRRIPEDRKLENPEWKELTEDRKLINREYKQLTEAIDQYKIVRQFTGDTIITLYERQDSGFSSFGDGANPEMFLSKCYSQSLLPDSLYLSTLLNIHPPSISDNSSINTCSTDSDD